MTPRDMFQKLLILILTATLTSCGGGGLAVLAGGVGTGGTGITWGTIIGFGSLVVDNKILDSATGTYQASEEQAESVQTSAMAVGLGQQVKITLDAQGKPQTVLVEPSLLGLVSAVVDATTFVVNGVSVRVNTDVAAAPVTYYSGLTKFSDIIPGMRVEIHGLYAVDSDGAYLLATRISQRPAPGATGSATRITGVISGLDTTSSTFKLAGTVVQYTNVSPLPSGIALADGQQVNVWSPNGISAGELTATVIRVDTLHGSSGTATIAGLVSNLSGTGFTLSGIAVIASQTVFGSLSNGEYVTVTGNIGADGNLDVANHSSVVPYSNKGINLNGTVTNFVSPANFQVRGVNVDASTVTASGTLGNGSYVEIHGKVEGNLVQADQLSIPNSVPSDSTVEFEGTVSHISGNQFTFTDTNGIQHSATLSANAGYENGTALDLHEGVGVEIEATQTASGLSVYGIAYAESTNNQD